LPNLHEFVHTAPHFGVFIIKRTNPSPDEPQTNLQQDKYIHPLKINGVYPNPFIDNMTVLFDSPDSSNVVLNLFDLSGRTVFSEEFWAVKGINRYNCNAGNLNKGVYVLNISKGSQRQSVRIVKK